MTTRSLVPVLIAGVVAAASGCHWFHRCFPCLSWRLHHWHHHHAPAIYDPVYAVPACPGPGYCPVPVYRPAGLSPVVPLTPQVICPDCGPEGGQGPAPTVLPPTGYAPVIGQPMPLPMPKVVPSDGGPSSEGKAGGN